MTLSPSNVNLAYLIASILFIVCLMRLSHPRTAVSGNLLGSLGMLIAIVVTIVVVKPDQTGLLIVGGGLVLGTIFGAILALKVHMTAMPQMVALLNGFGGLASVLVAGAALHEETNLSVLSAQLTISILASGLIGAVTFWGSLVAFDKLQGFWLPEKPILFKGQQPLNLLLGLVVLAISVWMVVAPENSYTAYWGIVVISSVLGVLLTIPIGGADMPVAIALLNSYSGLAGAATGFVLNNNILIIAGSLVGASGIILSEIMCKAMNRSLMNVLLGKIGETGTGPSADSIYAGKIKATTGEEVAMLLENAQRVVVVPGYGLAVSQAQHAVRDLTTLLEQRGITVEFAIHPVAGRMPGHMNILLAEVNIDYDKLKEMDEINPSFEQTDVAIVIGANDVVNPLARTDPNCAIAGMPILDVDKARTVIVVKRSLSPGFAGLPNPLFALDNTLMYFADAKKAVLEMIAAVKAA